MRQRNAKGQFDVKFTDPDLIQFYTSRKKKIKLRDYLYKNNLTISEKINEWIDKFLESIQSPS